MTTAKLMLVVLAGCSTSTADSTTPSTKSSRPRIPAFGCLDPKSPTIANVQASAAKKTTEARTKALQAIKPLVLKAHEREVGQGINQDPGRVLQGPVATTTIGGVTGRFVVGTTRWSLAGGQPEPAWQFGIVNGKAVRLVARAKVASETTLAICGCQPHTCGPFGSGCPGCGETTQMVYGPLPDGMDYGGDHAVPHDAHLVTLEYKAAKNCPAPRPCPMPP